MLKMLRKNLGSWTALVGLVLMVFFAMQVDARIYTTTSFEHEINRLDRTQHYAWWPEKETLGFITVYIDRSIQEAIVYRSDTMIGWSIVSTGRRGHETPSGTYKILLKHELYRSIRYKGAFMPHMQRLTDDGIAIHGGLVPNYPASHGCIRLPIEFAKLLYSVTDSKTRVEIY